MQLANVLPKKLKIYNDNMACVTWSKSKTTKGLRYIQIRENAVRENENIEVHHIDGKTNPSDMFSKEDKDVPHFQFVRDKSGQKPFARKCTYFSEYNFWSNVARSHIVGKQGGYCTYVRSFPTKVKCNS